MSDWTGERIAALTQHWADGLSASQCAKALGGFDHCRDGGRSAVIGKVARLKLSKRKTTQTVPLGERAKRRHKLTRMILVDAPPQVEAPTGLQWREPSSKNFCTILQLNDRTCRWPMWDDETPASEKFYCGTPEAAIGQGRPYCAYHTRISATGLPASEEAA